MRVKSGDAAFWAASLLFFTFYRCGAFKMLVNWWKSEVRSVAKFQKWIEAQGLTLLEGWSRDGLTDEQIARNMGIGLSTLYEWKKKFPELSEALKKGKEVVDYEVENALYKRALGYEYTEIMTEEGADGTKRRETIKQVAPDVTAQIFWLKNRRPDRWRNRPKEAAADTGDTGTGVVLLAPVESEE